MYAFAVFCFALLASCTSDTVDDIPIDNMAASAAGNQITVKIPAKDNIKLVIFHMSLEKFAVPHGGTFDSPIIKEAKDGHFQSTVTVPNQTDMKGKTVYYWIRLEVEENGKNVGHNSGVRTAVVS